MSYLSDICPIHLAWNDPEFLKLLDSLDDLPPMKPRNPSDPPLPTSILDINPDFFKPLEVRGNPRPCVHGKEFWK